MTIKFTKRAAAEIMGRGLSAIRVKPLSTDEATKAITRDDVRRLIGTGAVYAIPAKHNASTNSKILRRKRSEGRRRGIGMRRGTLKARQGRVWEKKVRSQRKFIKQLKLMKIIDNRQFNELYGHVKGNMYANKQSLIIHLSDQGIKITEQQMKQINEEIRKQYQ